MDEKLKLDIIVHKFVLFYNQNNRNFFVNPQQFRFLHKAVQLNPQALLFYTSASCGWCQQIIQRLTELSIEYQVKVPFILFNCSEGETAQFCKTQRVAKHPTIRLKTRGVAKDHEYAGDYSPASVRQFIQERELKLSEVV